jgi:hypothetical protein
MAKGTRIGPSMYEALRMVDRAGGAVGAKLDLAELVGPNGSRKYGYEIVDRCLGAGLLVIDPQHPASQGRRGGGAVVLTEAGRQALEDA